MEIRLSSEAVIAFNSTSTCFGGSHYRHKGYGTQASMAGLIQTREECLKIAERLTNSDPKMNTCCGYEKCSNILRSLGEKVQILVPIIFNIRSRKWFLTNLKPCFATTANIS